MTGRPCRERATSLGRDAGAEAESGRGQLGSRASRRQTSSASRRVTVSLLAALLGPLTACTGGPAQSSVPNEQAISAAASAPEHPLLLVELFSWWTQPGEAEALQSLVDAHKASYPDARLFNAAAASGTKAKEVLYARLERDDPPDLYQENAHDLRLYIETHPNKFESLSSLFDSLGLRSVLFPEVISDITVAGEIRSMPVNLHRENTLLYNKAIFEKRGLEPPRTLEDLLAVCEKLKSAGVVPFATAHQGWILRIMFNSLVMAKMGTARYRDYFAGKLQPDDPSFREGIDLFAEVLEKYVNPDAGEEGFNWTNAALALYHGDAAMFLHGDWAKGYLLQLGWRPGVDFGVSAAPGASDLFLYGVDVFALPRGAKNERGAREFLSTIASPGAQAAFNRVKGSSPIRLDAPGEALDVLGRETLAELKRAKIRMIVPTRPVWDNALGRFAIDRDKAALATAFVNNPP